MQTAIFLWLLFAIAFVVVVAVIIWFLGAYYSIEFIFILFADFFSGSLLFPFLI